MFWNGLSVRHTPKTTKTSQCCQNPDLSSDVNSLTIWRTALSWHVWPTTSSQELPKPSRKVKRPRPKRINSPTSTCSRRLPSGMSPRIKCLHMMIWRKAKKTTLRSSALSSKSWVHLLPNTSSAQVAILTSLLTKSPQLFHKSSGKNWSAASTPPETTSLDSFVGL